ncbi:MAG: hypothetical protein WDW38_005514 [Sanguina aurantia]
MVQAVPRRCPGQHRHSSVCQLGALRQAAQKKSEVRARILMSHQGHFLMEAAHLVHAMWPHSNATAFCRSMHTLHCMFSSNCGSCVGG